MYDYVIFNNGNGTYHILRLKESSGSGYIMCDGIQSYEDADLIAYALLKAQKESK